MRGKEHRHEAKDKQIRAEYHARASPILSSPSRLRRLRGLELIEAMDAASDLEDELIARLDDSDHLVQAETLRLLTHCPALRILATVSLVVMWSFQFVFLYNFINSLIRGPKAEKNPWRSNTLEWTTESPPPHGNWAELPIVYRGPYEYSVPDRAQDYWPQNEPA